MISICAYFDKGFVYDPGEFVLSWVRLPVVFFIFAIYFVTVDKSPKGSEKTAKVSDINTQNIQYNITFKEYIYFNGSFANADGHIYVSIYIIFTLDTCLTEMQILNKCVLYYNKKCTHSLIHEFNILL